METRRTIEEPIKDHLMEEAQGANLPAEEIKKAKEVKKQLIPCLYLRQERAVTGFDDPTLFSGGDPVRIAAEYGQTGADALLLFDLSEQEEEHEKTIGLIREIIRKAEIPAIGSGNIRRTEDVKKLLYAGCEKVVLNLSLESNAVILEEVSKRFGKERILAGVFTYEDYQNHQKAIERYAGGILCNEELMNAHFKTEELPVLVFTEEPESGKILSLLSNQAVAGVSGTLVSSLETDRMKLKKQCKEAGISVILFESRISWKDFKKNSDGMVPVIVQDYQTDEVLMLAYMNEEAFQTTLETGKMTYWSRSRDELWTKGMTSGHFQYVKSLTLDCDGDTILAKVSQVGAACHTGSRSCFFQELVKKPYDDTNPLRVFQNVFDVILDRKAHPKEGSYTNYLFDKGIDKILKKVGEECTEIVIAAKNPDKEEIKYEISDFLYHLMVLMAEKGVTWEEITQELARR